MDELDPPHSALSTNLILLRPQSQSLLSSSSEGSTETADSSVANDLEEAPERLPPKLTVVPSVPTIHLDQELHVVIEQAMRALAADPMLFAKGDQLVRVALDGNTPRLVALGAPQLRELLSVYAKWMRDDPVHPPAAIATALVKRGSWPPIRQLRAMTTFPVLSASGELRTREGYDPSSKTLYAGVAVVNVPEEPTLDEAKAACARLLDLVAEFPFAGEAHRSAWLAALLTPLSRFMHDGHQPLVVLAANMPGSGKTTLAQIIATIVTGGSISVMACEKDEPNRKELLSKLRAAPSLALIDNVVRRFGGPNMATLITGRSFEDRSLGHLKTLSAPNDTTWIITGNRISLAPDMARRCLNIRLQSNEQKPHLRDGFRYANLLGHVREYRGELLSDALTILKAYVLAGTPDVELSGWGSFEEWSRIVRGALVWCGLLDPASTRHELEDEAQDGIAEHARWVEAWFQIQEEMGREDGVTVNVFTGEHVGPEHRKNLYEVVVGASAVALAREIDKIDADARHIASEITETEKALRDLIQAPFPFEDFINLVAEPNLADKIRDCTTRLSAVRKQRDILARLQLDPLSAPALPDVFLKVLSKSVAQLSAETEERVRAHVRRLDHRGETWVRQGLGYVKDDRLCPFCGQDTAGTSLLALYSDFFSNAFPFSLPKQSASPSSCRPTLCRSSPPPAPWSAPMGAVMKQPRPDSPA